jgi:hypothetical protein
VLESSSRAVPPPLRCFLRIASTQLEGLPAATKDCHRAALRARSCNRIPLPRGGRRIAFDESTSSLLGRGDAGARPCSARGRSLSS